MTKVGDDFIQENSFRTESSAKEEYYSQREFMLYSRCPLSGLPCSTNCIMFEEGSVSMVEGFYEVRGPICKWAESILKERN